MPVKKEWSLNYCSREIYSGNPWLGPQRIPYRVRMAVITITCIVDVVERISLRNFKMFKQYRRKFWALL